MTTRRHEQPPLGRRLVSLRVRAYWSQRKLAAKSGLSEGMIAALEQGLRSDPRLSTVQKIADAFGMTLDELLGPALQQEGPGE
jgi:transcriptional regulator with XRE-family HTH domain